MMQMTRSSTDRMTRSSKGTPTESAKKTRNRGVSDNSPKRDNDDETGGSLNPWMCLLSIVPVCWGYWFVPSL